MTMNELNGSQLQVEGVLPRHALVLDRRPVHQLVRRPLKGYAVQDSARTDKRNTINGVGQNSQNFFRKICTVLVTLKCFYEAVFYYFVVGPIY